MRFKKILGTSALLLTTNFFSLTLQASSDFSLGEYLRGYRLS